MKKSFLIIAILLCGTTVSTAQEFVNFGIKGGVNFSNMTSNGFTDNNSRTGFHLGLLAEVPVGERFSFQPEVLYSTQGTEASNVIAGETFRGEYKLDYIQVPVLAKLFLLEGFSIEVGPSFNFLAKEEVEGDSPFGGGDVATDFGSGFEFGGALGASYTLPNGLFASARYTQGFTNAFDSDSWDEDAVNNNGFQVGLGLLF